MTNTAKIIETANLETSYGFFLTRAIVDHPEHGLIYIAQGFDGNVSWHSGAVLYLDPGETLSSLDHTDCACRYDSQWFEDYVCAPEDIAKLAEECGL